MWQLRTRVFPLAQYGIGDVKAVTRLLSVLHELLLFDASFVNGREPVAVVMKLT